MLHSDTADPSYIIDAFVSMELAVAGGYELVHGRHNRRFCFLMCVCLVFLSGFSVFILISGGVVYISHANAAADGDMMKTCD